MKNELTFNNTVKIQILSDNIELKLEEYYDENGKSIYNVALEYDYDESISKTTDLYESDDYNKVDSFYFEMLQIYRAGINTGKKIINFKKEN